MNGEILQPLLGGLIIGLAASLLLLFNGRILGVSGILFGAKINSPTDINWRLYFVLGMILCSFVMKYFFPYLFAYEFNISKAQIIIAGLLVGFGTRLGSGCTSGHGVCGLSRFSVRSLIAVGLFMTFAIITVTTIELLNG